MRQSIKYKWMMSLKIGDIVEDCGYRNLKIIEIEDETCVTTPRFINKIIYYKMIPLVIGDAIFYSIEWIYRKFGWIEVYNRIVTLEDNSTCSVMDCCDKPKSIHQ